jgi:predicted ester cyclase
MPTALEVVRSWQARLRAHDFGDTSDVVDVDGYTEICLGLTNWTVGYQVALQNYVKNMVQPWTDLEAREDQVVDGPDTVVIRSHVSATHTGECLGIPGTGRRVEWDAITMVQVHDGRVVGQWAQPDLFSIYRQLTGDQIGGVASPTAPSVGAPSWARATAVSGVAGK